MKVLRNFSRIIVGLLFIYSGFVKVVDPLGSAYKFTDYFVAMNLEFLGGAALTFAILMSAAELLLGIALLFNLVPKISSWGVLLFMGMFTPLTLWLAIGNPVQDCGCFGDALILTNWQTFFKNLVILVFVVIVFWQRKKFKPVYGMFWQWSLGVVFTAFTFWLIFYCLNNLPVIDFRAYHIGANITEGMIVPDEEKANVDVYESVFTYEKNGEQKAFGVDNLPDSTWTFVDAEHKLIKEGYRPPIHDFTIEPVYIPGFSAEPADEIYVNLYDAQFFYSKDGETEMFTVESLPDSTWVFTEMIYESELDADFVKLIYLAPSGDEEYFTVYNCPSDEYVFLDAEYPIESAGSSIPYGEDIADIVLDDDNYFFIAVMTYVDDAKPKNLEKINEIAAFCQQESYNFYCLTASNVEEIEEFIKTNDPIYDFYNTDPITLKTIVRSNPGLLLLKKGTVVDKWSSKNIPDVNDLSNDLMARSVTIHQAEAENILTITYVLALLLFMAVFHIFYIWLIQNKYINNN
jgi:uncharacterized membrane protein YphA (DoxX/SURF4 family)